MKALFILARDSTYRARGAFPRSISYAPLSLTVVAALAPPGWEVTLVDEGVQRPVTSGRYDVVGVSCVAASSARAYELTRFWRARGAHTILGGVHPSLVPDEAARHADTVVVGYAEDCLAAFWADFAAGCPRPVYRDSLGARGGPGGGAGLTLSMPRPRRDLLTNRYMSAVGVIANRGCRHRCTFCAIGAQCRHRDIVRPVGEVVAELRSLRRRRVVFLDPSLTSDRDYALELMAAIAPLKLTWGALATIDVADDPGLLTAMTGSGCMGLLIGFESITQASLVGSAKTINRASGYREVVAALHGHGLGVLGTFVVGFDEDTTESLAATGDAIAEIGVDLPRFGILTPFPGTPLHRRLADHGRILTGDLRLYDEAHAVFQPKNMTATELERAYAKLWRESYSFRRIAGRATDPLSWSLNVGFRHHGRQMARVAEKGGAPGAGRGRP